MNWVRIHPAIYLWRARINFHSTTTYTYRTTRKKFYFIGEVKSIKGFVIWISMCIESHIKIGRAYWKKGLKKEVDILMIKNTNDALETTAIIRLQLGLLSNAFQLAAMENLLHHHYGGFNLHLYNRDYICFCCEMLFGWEWKSWCFTPFESNIKIYGIYIVLTR